MDTSNFHGNHAPSISIEVTALTDQVNKNILLLILQSMLPYVTRQHPSIVWRELIPKTPCKGCFENYFAVPPELIEQPGIEQVSVE